MRELHLVRRGAVHTVQEWDSVLIALLVDIEMWTVGYFGQNSS
jgi:hypothetical protein